MARLGVGRMAHLDEIAVLVEGHVVIFLPAFNEKDLAAACAF